MKKVLVGMFALAMCLGLTTSCNQKGDPKKAEADSAAVVKQDAPAQPRALADIVKDAQEKGAKWSVDEWKAAFKELAGAIMPIMAPIYEAQQAAEKDPAKLMDMAKALEDVQKNFPDLDKQMGEFVKAAEATENGKKVSEDEAFQKELEKEFNIPDL